MPIDAVKLAEITDAVAKFTETPNAIPKTILTTKEENETQEEIEIAAPRVYTEVEKEAIEMGWKPEGVKSADEFIRAAPLYDRIKKDSREIKDLKNMVEELKKFQNVQRKLGYEQAIKELQEQRADAIALSDVEEVDRVEQKMKEVEAEHSDLKQDNSLPPEAMQFAERHKDWMQSTSAQAAAMRAFVVQRDQELMGNGLSPKDHIDQVEHDLKEAFSGYFKKSEEPEFRHPAVASDGIPIKGSRKKELGFEDLSSVQKDIARQFARKGVMTTEEYIKQLKAIGEL